MAFRMALNLKVPAFDFYSNAGTSFLSLPFFRDNEGGNIADTHEKIVSPWAKDSDEKKDCSYRKAD